MPAMGALGRLPPAAALLLFTPVTMPSGYTTADAKPVVTSSRKPNNAKLATDPFEKLGRAFGNSRRRVRHVPYVPSVGFTDTHDVFLKDADAVIVVTCTPAPLLADAAGSIARQAVFAEHAVDALEDVENNVPMVNLHFGGEDDYDDDDGLRDAVAATPYKHVWAGEKYDDEAVKSAVRLLFGGGK